MEVFQASGAYFEANGGALAGKDGTDNYSLQEIEYVKNDGSIFKVKGYFNTPSDTGNKAWKKKAYDICVGTDVTSVTFLVDPSTA